MPGGTVLVAGYDDDPVASATLPEESVVAGMTGDAITPWGAAPGDAVSARPVRTASFEALARAACLPCWSW